MDRVLILIHFFMFVKTLLAVVISRSHPSLLKTNEFQTSDGYVALEWNYEKNLGPRFWPFLYPGCAGISQSPVALRTVDAVSDPSLGPVELFGYNNRYLTMKGFNNGHVVKFQVIAHAPPRPKPARLQNSRYAVDNSYHLAEIHIHWGNANNRGSEHSLDGRYFPAEIHFVHKLSRLSMDQALNTPKGLAVLGAFIGIGQTDNPAYEPITASLAGIMYKNMSNSLPFRETLRKLLPQDVSQFFRYDGSLTTPTCNEVVVWTVYKNPVWISMRQMSSFRRLMKTYQNEPPQPLRDNFRPVQPINGRQIYKYGFH
ncbi:Carbonic anhydrase 14 [Holothuria leucospilota]|uniref:Carbonic anhydrase n=1 Tax=Holothuria leucospilota TaxID=206669 RepID=A0A9Q1C029_HOLLE|nr:Carbonic anhydrase 14 [Holothuria leucospilota]